MTHCYTHSRAHCSRQAGFRCPVPSRPDQDRTDPPVQSRRSPRGKNDSNYGNLTGYRKSRGRARKRKAAIS